MSRRNSTVKHLGLVIVDKSQSLKQTQAAEGSCKPFYQLYWADPSLPVAVKWIKTVKDKREQLVIPEETPIVLVEKKVESRRRLARLRKDYQAVEKLRQHIAEVMDTIKGKLEVK